MQEFNTNSAMTINDNSSTFNFKRKEKSHEL